MDRWKRSTRYSFIVGMALVMAWACMPARPVAAAYIGDIDVTINGLVPSNVTDVHLRENVTVSVAWELVIEHPELEMGAISFRLENEGGYLRNSMWTWKNESGRYTTNWTFPLLPGEWTMNGRDELGHVIVFFYIDDLYGHSLREKLNCTIRVLPEQVELAMDGHRLVNGTAGTIEGWEGYFSLASVADGTFHHPGLAAWCDILNETGQGVETLPGIFNDTGQVTFAIGAAYMLELERYTLLVRTNETDHLDGAALPVNLSSLFTRTALEISYLDKSEVDRDGDRFIRFSFNASTVDPVPGIDLYNLSVAWSLVNASNVTVHEEATWQNISGPVVVDVPSAFFDLLESLDCILHFPGNFLVQGATFTLPLSGVFNRTGVALDLVNLDWLLAGNATGMVFQIRSTGFPVNVSGRAVTAAWTGHVNSLQHE